MRCSVYIGASLDGFIARSSGELDFLDAVEHDPEDTSFVDFMADIDRPIGLVQGEFDEHGPLDAVERFWRGVPDPKQLRVVPGAGHFFDDEQVELMEAVQELATGAALGPVLRGA